MKIKGSDSVRLDFARISDRGSVVVHLAKAAERPRDVGFGRALAKTAVFEQGRAGAGAAGALSRHALGVRLWVGASRGRVEVQTSGARGLPRDVAL